MFKRFGLQKYELLKVIKPEGGTSALNGTKFQTVYYIKRFTGGIFVIEIKIRENAQLR